MGALFLQIKTEDLVRSLTLEVDVSKITSETLKEFGKYLRMRARARFVNQGPGWAPPAQSTKERLQATRTHRITARGKLRATARQKLEHKIRADIRKGKAGERALLQLRKLVAPNDVTDKTAGLREGLRWGDYALPGLADSDIVAGKNKTLSRLAKDLGKAKVKTAAQRRSGKRASDKHRLLGKLASTLRASVKQNHLKVDSKVAWAGVHNEGGTAGRGSKIPARPFLFLEDEDIEFLIERLEARLVEDITT